LKTTWLPDTYDLLFLGACDNPVDMHPVAVGHGLYDVSASCPNCLHAYILWPRGAQALLDALPSPKQPTCDGHVIQCVHDGLLQAAVTAHPNVWRMTNLDDGVLYGFGTALQYRGHGSTLDPWKTYAWGHGGATCASASDLSAYVAHVEEHFGWT
jgi:hypothetical protein